MVMHNSIHSKHWEDTEKLGETLGREIVKPGNPHVVLLTGVLGSGKSVFVRGIGRALGIEARILSPTFVLLRRYPCPANPEFTLYHYDLYRITGKNDPVDLEIEEVLKDPQAIVSVEWAERLGKISVPYYQVTITNQNEDERLIEIETGEYHER